MIFKRLRKLDPKAEEKFRNEIEEHGGLEDKDVPAMIIAGLLVVLPAAFIVLLLFCLIAMLFF